MVQFCLEGSSFFTDAFQRVHYFLVFLEKLLRLVDLYFGVGLGLGNFFLIADVHKRLLILAVLDVIELLIVPTHRVLPIEQPNQIFSIVTVPHFSQL